MVVQQTKMGAKTVKVVYSLWFMVCSCLDRSCIKDRLQVNVVVLRKFFFLKICKPSFLNFPS